MNLNPAFVSRLGMSIMLLVPAGLFVAKATAQEGLLGASSTLEIYGNANGDWRIDEHDVTYLQQIIAGEAPESEFADANRDGVIDQRDVEHVQSIVDGTAGFIWMLDGNGDPIRIALPIARIGVEYLSNAELMRVLGVSDRVVALDAAAYIMRDVYFPGRDDLLQMGQMHANPDYESIFDMELDVLFTFAPSVETKQASLPNTDVVFLGLYWPNVIEPEDSRFLQGVVKAGYLLGAEERAFAYVDWLLGLVDEIGSRTAAIPMDERPSVLMTSHNRYFQDGETMASSIYTRIDPLTQACLLAGGRPVAEDIPEWMGEGGVYGTTVDMEWVMTRDPDFIFAHSVRYTYSGIAREPSYGYDEDDRSALDAALATMKELPLLRDLSAVTEGNTYITAGDFRNNAMGGILAAAYLAKILHPDLFADFDPQLVHQAFISDWMEIDFELSHQGVFIAPALPAR